MSLDPKFSDPDKILFNETDFTLLMQKRIRKVLLICSSYDAFMLEEDGRIEEQIFSEYVSLNLRQPPGFIHCDSAKKAFTIIETEQIDLVIEMLSIPDVDPFELAHKIKEKHPRIPVVALTHFSREVSLKLKNEDLTGLDYIFCWLGNADLLLAIIKLIEDRMNAEYDINTIGVQAILLVEDSIRFTSVYLPDIYKIVIKQSKEFLKEALNEHQRRLRMRGRPKILLAKTYNEALMLYRKYKNNLLGIISDISIKEDIHKSEKIKGGIQLCQLVKTEDPYLPFVFQSSDLENKNTANELKVQFIHKYSKTLTYDLQKFIVENLNFGDFIFRDPESLKEVARASDLVSLQHLILKISDNSLIYHSSKNDISKWLNARSLFPIASIFRKLTIEDFQSLSEIRDYLFKAIGNYRLSRVKGMIASFDRTKFDEYQLMNRIGEGSVGGKARGLVFLSSIIKRYNLQQTYPEVQITVPRSIVLTTEIFEKFMDRNNLYPVALSSISDEEMLNIFLQSTLPESLTEDLKVFISIIKNPIAIRSSSKLEDSQYQPFAGIYSTYMVPTVHNNPELTLRFVMDSIKAIYASVYYKSSKAYMTATANIIDEEKMGIVLQEVCGNHYNNRFYPTISGVARSINFYPIKPERPNDGIVNIGFGLGKYVMDGGTSLRFSPKHPKNILQLSSVDMALKDTQKIFYALDLSDISFKPSVDDSANLLKLKISNAENDASLHYVASTFDHENNIIREGTSNPGMRIITFSNILEHNTFPLADILDTMLEIGHQEMGSPVEIEFAVNLDVPNNCRPEFYILQIRPIVINDQRITFRTETIQQQDTIIQSNFAMGNGIIETIYDLVYIKPETFQSIQTKQIALCIENRNTSFIQEKRNYVLIGPGRWGSNDPSLGIPVKWTQISEARVIVESGLNNYRIDPSQGTHFFQNLTSLGVGYLTINPFINEGFLDIDYLNSLQAFYEDEFIRHIRFNNPIKIYIDGRKNSGVILKPASSS